MVFVCNTRNFDQISKTDLDAIANSGVPLSFFQTGVLKLGANNRSAIDRLANIGSIIFRENLPLPPSLFIEFVCSKTSGVSKQDYRMTLDGEPGMGKSYGSTYLGGRYGIEMADINGQDPKDYFSLDNCALLQDTEGVTRLMDECDKYQAVIIDDAGIAAGNRDFLTQSNKNMSAILQVCRTKRWFLIYNMPNRRHVDLQIRELVYAKGYIYKSFHSAGFNVVKINREQIDIANVNSKVMRRRLTLGGQKISFHLQYSPEILDPYKGLIAKYDMLRDAATDALIHERAVDEQESNEKITKKQKEWEDKIKLYYPVVKDHIETMKSSCAKLKRSTITAMTGLSDRDVLRLIAKYNVENPTVNLNDAST